MKCRACGAVLREVDTVDQLCSGFSVATWPSCLHRFSVWNFQTKKSKFTNGGGGVIGHFDFADPAVNVAFDEWLSLGAP